MFTEDDLLPLSALQHLLFCERQCALIHIEQQWSENRRTVEGKQLHERVHEQGAESRGDVRIARGLLLRSLRLGLIAKADVVEFHRREPCEDLREPSQGSPPTVAPSEMSTCLWQPFPVEYKRGEPKKGRYDEVQLCAQALCLEEMLHLTVPAGALFYGATRRRMEVVFAPALRQLTEETATRLHRLIDAGITPPPDEQPRCKNCSLIELCLPKAASGRSAAKYLQRTLREETDD